MSRSFHQDSWDLVRLGDEDGQVCSGAAGPCLVALVHGHSVQQAYVLHLSPTYAYLRPQQLRECLDCAASVLPKEVEVWLGGCAPNDAADHRSLRSTVQQEVQSRWPLAEIKIHWIDDDDTSVEFELDVETNSVRVNYGTGRPD